MRGILLPASHAQNRFVHLDHTLDKELPQQGLVALFVFQSISNLYVKVLLHLLDKFVASVHL
jgi:hypothetical protein